MSYRKDAREQEYEIVELFDRDVLFTCVRIDQSTVPKGYYRYEVRHDDDCCGIPCQLSRNIIVNHWGTVITDKPFNIGGDGYIYIDGENDWNYTGETMTLSEYMKEHPAKKAKEHER